MVVVARWSSQVPEIPSLDEFRQFPSPSLTPSSPCSPAASKMQSNASPWLWGCVNTWCPRRSGDGGHFWGGERAKSLGHLQNARTSHIREIPDSPLPLPLLLPCGMYLRWRCNYNWAAAQMGGDFRRSQLVQSPLLSLAFCLPFSDEDQVHKEKMPEFSL